MSYGAAGDIQTRDQGAFFTGKSHKQAPFVIIEIIYIFIRIIVAVEAVGEFYVEKWNFPYCPNAFLSTTDCVRMKTFTQAVWKAFLKKVSHRKSLFHPQAIVDK